MTDPTRAMLEAAITAQPECLTAQAALCDYLQEQGEDSVSAMAQAIYVSACATNARDMAEAAAFIARKSVLYRRMVAMLADYVGVMNESRFSLHLADGSNPPTVAYARQTQGSEWWYFATITVGAGWVVKWVRNARTQHENELARRRARRAVNRQK